MARLRSFLILATLVTLVPACAAPLSRTPREPAACLPREPLATIALEGGPSRAIVRGRLAGQTLHLLLDTGFPGTMLTESAARRLGLPRESRIFAQITGLGGVADVSTVSGESLSIAGLATPAEHIFLLPTATFGPGVDGLVGLDVFGRYALELDMPNHTLALFADEGCATLPAGWPASAAPMRVPITLDGRMLVPARIGGKPVTALLDTGAERSVMKRATADGLAEPVVSGAPPVRVIGLDGVTNAYRLRHLDGLDIAGRHLAGLDVATGPFSLPGDLVLGMDWLARQPVWMDFPRRLVALAPMP